EEERATLVDAVGDRAVPRREQHQGPELACRERAHGEAAVSELEREEEQRDVGELVARVRDELADEEEPEVAGRERLERLRERCPRATACSGRGGRNRGWRRHVERL